MSPKMRFRQMWRDRRAPALISVHRGLWGPLPENSRAGIREGAALGIVEIDTQIAADGVPVVMHDTSLQRMSGELRSVGELNSSDIGVLKLREGEGGPDAAFTSETVPTLKSALQGAPEGAFFDIDVKHPGEVDAVAAFLAEHELGEYGSLKIDVETPDDIERLRAMENRFGLMVMAKVAISPDRLALFPALVAAGVVAAEVWFDNLGLLHRACAQAGDGLAVSTYTLDPVHCCGLSDAEALKNPDAVWGRLVAAGVTVLMTDRARELAGYLERSGA